MSVLFCDERSCLLDHQDFVSKTYNNVLIAPNVYKSLAIISKIFSVAHDIKTVRINNSRKRKKDLDCEASVVQAMFEKVLPEVKNYLRDHLVINTSLVRNKAKELFESTTFFHNGISGGNNSNCPLKCKINDEYFIIPQNSRFYCGDIIEYCLKLDGCKYDIVLADPPWWNKYIRRLKAANSKLSYSMMYNEEIAAIPVKNLLAENCLVAVWCTNSPSNINAVKELIFPKWGVEYVATWFWLKVTTDFKPLYNFGSACKKQPYERIILGKVGEVKVIPNNYLVMSVPSALHSHKPPLCDILKPYLENENPKTLELFARYLLPDTTSVGYEPLKWQHISLYEELEETSKLDKNTNVTKYYFFYF